MREQIDFLHTCLIGWPCDHLTPTDQYLAMSSPRDVAIAILRSDRFRWAIRDKVSLWPTDKWVCTDYAGFKIWINLRDSFIAFGVLHEFWEEQETAFMRSVLKPGDGMIDIGANVGVFSLHAAKAVGPTGHVYAYEANPKTAQMLQRTMRDNDLADNVTVHAVGLGAEPSTGSFLLSGHAENPGASFVSTAIGVGETIQIEPLDSFSFSKPIKFIKIDVEGFEPHVVAGAKKTIAEHRPIVLTEYYPKALREVGRSSSMALLGQWAALDYDLQVFLPDGKGRRIAGLDAAEFENITEPLNLVCWPR